MKESVVEPLDYLFCEKCNKHVSTKFHLDGMVVGKKEPTAEDRAKRVAPEVFIKIWPICMVCRTKLIQKFVWVEFQIEI